MPATWPLNPEVGNVNAPRVYHAITEAGTDNAAKAETALGTAPASSQRQVAVDILIAYVGTGDPVVHFRDATAGNVLLTMQAGQGWAGRLPAASKGGRLTREVVGTLDATLYVSVGVVYAEE